MKTCSKCKEEKPLSDYYIVYEKYLARCKNCVNADCKKYVTANSEKRKKYQDDYNKKNKDKQIIHKRKYQQKQKIILRKKGVERYAKKRDVLLQQTKKQQKMYADTLHDAYMKQHMRKLGYTKEQIKGYPELTETIKLIIKTKRLCKTSQN